MQDAFGHDDRHRQRVAVLRHTLTRRQPEADNAHGRAVGDTLPPEWPVLHRRRIIIAA